MSRALALSAMLVAASALPHPAQAAQRPAKDPNLHLFLRTAAHACFVARATVTQSRVAPLLNVRRTEPGKNAFAEDVSFKTSDVLYAAGGRNGPHTVRVAATPPRRATAPPPRFQNGDKLLVLQIDYPQWQFSLAVSWSKAAEDATLEALAPAWVRRDGTVFLCPWCAARDLTADVGKCATCGARTASGMKRLCHKCASKSGHCQVCSRTVGPPTLKVQLLLKTLSPKLRVEDPLSIAVAPGADVRLYLWVESRAKAVPELACWDNDLRTCYTLCFLIEGPGANDRRTAFFDRRVPPGSTHRLPKPLAGSPFAELKLTPAALFQQRGTYTVRAVAGRLLSNPVKVTVKDLGAGEQQPQAAQPPPGAVYNAGGRVLSRTKNGRILWKMKSRSPIGHVREHNGLWIVTSADGRTETTVHPPTGKTLQIKKLGR